MTHTPSSADSPIADPARALDPLPSEELLARLLAKPRPARQGKRTAIDAAFVPALALARATAAGVRHCHAPRAGPSLDLAARAYAATGVPRGRSCTSSRPPIAARPPRTA